MGKSIRSISLSSTRSIGGFWKTYQDNLSQKGLLAQWKQIVDTGRLANFEKVAAGETSGHTGYRFNDSDVYKWLEACAYSLHFIPNAEIIKAARHAVDVVGKAQAEDGYLYTLAQLDKPYLKWASLAHSHEMYCMGHLIEAAIAMEKYAGESDLMKIAMRIVAHVQARYSPTAAPGYDGHPEFELAVYRLSRYLKRTDFAEWMDWMLDIRGHRPSPLENEFFTELNDTEFPGANALYVRNGKYEGQYAQDHLPIREQKVIVGHAVRAAYLYTAAAMSAERRGDSELLALLEENWSHLTQTRMYVTGGIGSAHENEGFSADFDLPNLTAYSETCATIALAMWGRRMFEATGNADYIDIIERALFNGILSGISLDTTHYYYDNPLESRGNHERKPWFGCACCPPNIARLIGAVTEYAFWSDAETIYIGIPVEATFDATVNSQKVTVKIETDYPNSGKVKISLSSDRPTNFKLALRIPEWASEVLTDYPGQREEAEYEQGFSVFNVQLQGSEVIEVDMPMLPEIIEAHPSVLDNIGRVAITLGPSIYCLEANTLKEAPQGFEIDLGQELGVSSAKGKDGSSKVTVFGVQTVMGSQKPLYEPLGGGESKSLSRDLVPYRTWANGGSSFMQVWIRSH